MPICMLVLPLHYPQFPPDLLRLACFVHSSHVCSCLVCVVVPLQKFKSVGIRRRVRTCGSCRRTIMNLNILLGDNEESASSMISNTAAITTHEGSDSNDITPLVPPPKRLKSTQDPTPSSLYKGVVVQQNGHWGAQIYADQRRIWLGTFRSEEAAAVAYDRAATKLCHDDAHRNYPPSPSPFEPLFQHLHPTDTVLDMIRDGSYDTKFAEFMYRSGHSRPTHVSSETGTITHELFQKELTPSDVGKLNRLVIPKKHAVRYFPSIKAASNGDHEPGGEGAEGMMLEFKDRQGRKWDFRYCYWKSSQSFVFTKGWNKFVKTKELAAKDTVVFYRRKERAGTARPFCMIDVEYTSHDEADVLVGRREVEEKKGFKLFGVHIC